MLARYVGYAKISWHLVGINRISESQNVIMY